MPASKKLVEIVLGPDVANKIWKTPPVLVDIIGRQVSDMSSDIEDIMKEKINSNETRSLQSDESIDISGHTQPPAKFCWSMEIWLHLFAKNYSSHTPLKKYFVQQMNKDVT